MHDVKRAQRPRELLLDQAEKSVRVFAGPERAEKLTGNLDAAWEDLLDAAEGFDVRVEPHPQSGLPVMRLRTSESPLL